MAVEAAFASVLAAALTGLMLSLAIECLMAPRPTLARPWNAWMLHGGLWLSTHAVLTLMLGRPWFAAAAISAFLLTLVLVNNAKVKALGEPFVFQDYEYFTDAIRHPRLYIPFLGWWKFFGAATGVVLAVAIGLWWESTPASRFAWSGQLGGVAVMFAGGVLLLLAGKRKPLAVTFDPERDTRALGLLASLWRYGEAERAPLAVAFPFDLPEQTSIRERESKGHCDSTSPLSWIPDHAAAPLSGMTMVTPSVLPSFPRKRESSSALKSLDARRSLPSNAFIGGGHDDKVGSQSDLPHLVAVQSESFFDPRSLYSGIRTDVLAEFDRLRDSAVAYGKLRVPAWGANTVRSEFAFLSGVGEQALGVHRFNPYRAIAAGWDVPSVASYVKRLGYRTICIHPYPASFYRRDRVYPRLGFDEFVDIRSFGDAVRSGPYISDAAVADKVAAILQTATVPTFIFVITMENHGPLHLERVAPSDIDALYAEPPPAGCEDLTIYLRHLRNADRMIAKLRHALEQSKRPASLCWFGDHVPIMPAVYERFGKPNGEVDYVLWSNRNTKQPQRNDLAANDLSMRWLRELRVVDDPGISSDGSGMKKGALAAPL